MTQVPFRLCYELNRRQRLVPHLKVWGSLGLFAVLGLTGLLYWLLARSWWFLPLTLGWVLLFGGFYRGLLDVLLHPRARMDLLVEDNGLGILIGQARWWLFLDGVPSVEQLARGVWTVQHWNGSVVHIPAAAITEDQVAQLKEAAARGPRPEQVRAVIERGRLLKQLEEQERNERGS